jgi:signal transduction histidine kinase
MCDLIDGAIEEVRGLAGRLRPGALDRLGLVDAVDWYLRDFEKRTDVACDFRHDGVPKVNDRVATAAYRIVQESLTNVARHAGASHVDVSLRVAGKRLILDVEDDGRGFDPRGVPGSGGLGVAGMRERAALIGGTLDIRTAAGGGTRVSLSVPLEGHGGEAAP